MKKILFVTPYPQGEAPSQRFRFEQYFDALTNAGYIFKVHSFLSPDVWKILYKKNYFFKKSLGIIQGFIFRFLLLFHISKFEFIFIHREATPIGPAWFEWIAIRIFKKKIIYDFDDAIWLENVSTSNRMVSQLKNYSKVSGIIKRAYKISCGNDFLCQYALKYNAHVVLNPTTIDTKKYHNQSHKHQEKLITIGWTGTHSTIKYLETLLPVFQNLEEKYTFKLRIISNQNPKWKLNSLEFIPWNKETEIEDLNQIDIGLMPIADDDWSKGKCGFKALQYMSLGIPALVSPVGVNCKIVDHGINGYWCASNEEWESALQILLADTALRAKMGEAAQHKIDSQFSVNANTQNFLQLFS